MNKCLTDVSLPDKEWIDSADGFHGVCSTFSTFLINQMNETFEAVKKLLISLLTIWQTVQKNTIFNVFLWSYHHRDLLKSLDLFEGSDKKDHI